MAYRKVFAMHKQWSVQVVKWIHGWANGGWDANEMTWENPCTSDRMNQWVSELMVEWIGESMSQWISEPLKQWVNEGMHHWIDWVVHQLQLTDDSVNQWMSDLVRPWINVQWINEIVSRSVNEPLNQRTVELLIHWTTCSLLFSQLLLL